MQTDLKQHLVETMALVIWTWSSLKRTAFIKIEPLCFQSFVHSCILVDLLTHGFCFVLLLLAHTRHAAAEELTKGSGLFFLFVCLLTTCARIFHPVFQCSDIPAFYLRTAWNVWAAQVSIRTSMSLQPLLVIGPVTEKPTWLLNQLWACRAVILKKKENPAKFEIVNIESLNLWCFESCFRQNVDERLVWDLIQYYCLNVGQIPEDLTNYLNNN